MSAASPIIGRMTELKITREMLTGIDMSPCWWLCSHGLVSARNRFCRFGCDAHTQVEVDFINPSGNLVKKVDGRRIGSEPHHAGYGEYTPWGDVTELTRMVSEAARGLGVLRSPMWLCRHGFIDCWSPRCSRGCCAGSWVVVWLPTGVVSIHPGASIRARADVHPRPELAKEIDMEWIEVLIATWLKSMGINRLKIES